MAPRSDDARALGKAITDLRRKAGISQEDLAAKAGMHRTYVGGIERGERNPAFANLLRISEALAVTPSELLRQFERERRR